MRNLQIPTNQSQLSEFCCLLNLLAKKFDNVKPKKQGFVDSKSEVLVKDLDEDKDLAQPVMNSKQVSSIVHDLKSPISCSESLVDILEDNIKSGSDDQVLLEALEDLRKVNFELNELVHDLLDFNLDGDIASYKINLVDDVNISQVFFRALKLNLSFAIKKEIKLVKHFDDDIKFDQIDPRRLKQVLTNLISNSIKYSSSSTQIDLFVNKVGDSLELVVKDQGYGIAKKDLRRIFEPNVRLNKKDNSDSHGLGLMIVKQLVEAMGGQVSVNSKLGSGSEFKVIFG